MEEIWKPINYGEGYEISNTAKVRKVYKTLQPKILKTKLCKSTGYLMINLSFEGKQKTFTIHSLVARAFIKDYDSEKEMVNHKNGNKLINEDWNLEITDRSGNVKHAMRTGLMNTNHKIIYQGIEYLSKTQMRKVLHMGESVQNRLIENGEAILLTNKSTSKNAKTHRVLYQDKVYESKVAIRKEQGISERKLNKLISEGTIKVL